MAPRPASTVNDWQTVDPGDWQTVGESVPGMEKLGGTPPPAPKPPKPRELGGAPTGAPATGLRRVLGGEHPDQPPQGKIPVVSDIAQGGPDIVSGAARMGADITPDEKAAGMTRGRMVAGGASQALRGGMKLGSVMLPQAMATAPVRTALSLGIGGAVGGAANESARAAGLAPEYSDLIGDVAGLATGSRIATAGNPLKADPRIAINRGLRPVPSNPDFPADIPKTLSAIKAANGDANPGGKAVAGIWQRGGITDGTLDLVPAANKAIKVYQDALDTYLTRAKGVKVSGDEIVQATKGAIPKMMWERDPKGAQGLIDDAQRSFGGKMYDVAEFREFLKSENADLSKFYNTTPANQQNAAIAGTPQGIQDAQTRAIRETLYKALDPETGGQGPRDIQRMTGNIIEMRNAASRRNNAIVAEQPLTPMGQVFDPIKGALRAMMPGKSTGSGIAYAEGSEGRSLPMIRRAFDAVEGQDAPPIPRPASPLYPTGNPQRMLPGPNMAGIPGVGAPSNTGQTGGTMYTPPPADSSSVRAVPGMAQPPNPKRAIPQGGQGPIIVPPPPDRSGVNVTTGPPLQAPPSRQIAPAPLPRSFSDLSGQAGDITDTIPVVDPATGLTYYMPRPKSLGGTLGGTLTTPPPYRTPQ